MDELKLLVEMISNLPQMTVWVLVGYLIYKVVVVGSIYGVIRLAIGKLYDWAVKPKIEFIEMKPMLEGMCISGTLRDLAMQIQRVGGIANKRNGSYVGFDDAQWLREAIDEKIVKDKEGGNA